MIANSADAPFVQDSQTIPCAAVVVNDSELGDASQVMKATSDMARSDDQGTSDILPSDDETIVLDISPMEEEGAELIRQIQQTGQMPIIVLSTGKQTLKLSNSNAEPHARLRIVRCRMVGATSPTSTTSVFHSGELRVDLVRRFVTVRGEPVRLSRNEFRLLAAFVRNAGKTLTGRQLLEESFGADTKKTEHYLRMYIMLLRRRIERNAGKPRYIVTDRNRGYRLASPQPLAFSAMKRPA